MRHIRRILLAVALLSSGMAFGQITEDPEDRERGNQGYEPLRTQTPEGRPLPFWQRLRVGGGITGFRFGNPFSLGAAPVVAYQASERLVLGIGGSYTYTRYKAIDRVTGRTIPFETYNQFGARGFAMFEALPSVIPNLYLHGEVDNSAIQVIDNINGGRQTASVTAPLLGLTFSQRVGRLAGVNITALYNLNYNGNRLNQAIYGSPFVFRISFF
ncbi:hypothetical protein [Rudanella lutea]|uniref:hypothetical protein n=1 Tax=Rudanella lutea TaxID=451374 RepID=UPI00037D2362|nr:hypothetical protein [Rudanella lutea]